ncbi:MAG: hypothetical protein JSV52_12395 [Candidatus Zixiibacteriota bacterium]|nr:MAG: hypothetical protein JSV52_12395 [candidate division Zixibacteria bacterium]
MINGINTLVLSLLLSVGLCVPAQSQEKDTLYLSLANLEALTESCTTSTFWKYYAGDDPAYAESGFDDTRWARTPTAIDVEQWVGGTGPSLHWFRLHLKIDSSLWNRPIYLDYDIAGAAEFYLDGKLLLSVGVVGATEETEEAMYTDRALPPAIVFPAKEYQILAVRFSAADPTLAKLTTEVLGFILYPLASDQENRGVVNQLMEHARQHWFFTGVTLSFALLHTLMFFLYPRFRENLYFALLAFSCAGLTSAPAWFLTLPRLELLTISMSVLKIAMVVSVMCAQAILHSLFRPGLPWRFWVLLVLGLGMMVLSVHIPTNIFFLFVAVALLDTVNDAIRAMLTHKPMAWVLGVGFATFTVTAIWELLAAIRILPYIKLGVPLYLLGIMVLIVSLSLYLALRYAQTSRSLEDKVALENAHRELEEAHRKLHETQSQLIQSAKMASLGQLVAGVAHEINTPVGAVASMHNTLVRATKKIADAVGGEMQSGCERCEEVRSMLALIEDANKVIETGTGRVTDIVKRLRSFARLDEADMKEVDIHEGLEDSLLLIHHEIKNRIRIIRQYGDLPPVNCFPGKLNQVFLNILNNARQAIPDEGQITVTTFARGDKVHVSIEDTGIGIPKDKIDRIFDPGYTTKGVKVGTGLGLAICYQIVQEHRGKITVESEPGKGTKFTVILPINFEKTVEKR